MHVKSGRGSRDVHHETNTFFCFTRALSTAQGIRKCSVECSQNLARRFLGGHGSPKSCGGSSLWVRSRLFFFFPKTNRSGLRWQNRIYPSFALSCFNKRLVKALVFTPRDNNIDMEEGTMALVIQTELAERLATSAFRELPAELSHFPHDLVKCADQIGTHPLLTLDLLAPLTAFLKWLVGEKNEFIRRHVHRVFVTQEKVCARSYYYLSLPKHRLTSLCTVCWTGSCSGMAVSVHGDEKRA